MKPNISELGPGRKLDALVAEKQGWEWYHSLGYNVLLPPYDVHRNRYGWTKGRNPDCEDDIESLHWHDSSRGGATMPIPQHYSTDIAAAWQLVEAMEQSGVWVQVGICNALHGPMKRAWVTYGDYSLISDGDTDVYGDTPMHAICLAYLTTTHPPQDGDDLRRMR